MLGAVKEGTVNRHMLLLLSPSYGPPEVYLPGRSSKTIMDAAKDGDDDVLVRGRITSATMASRVIQLEGRTAVSAAAGREIPTERGKDREGRTE